MIKKTLKNFLKNDLYTGKPTVMMTYEGLKALETISVNST